MGELTGHPWMGNALPDLKASMLKEIGAPSIDALFEQIPADHRIRKALKLSDGIRSEALLRRRLTNMMAQNQSAATHLTFLGAGCWPHHVPAVVDEIVGRTEFLTPVWGSPQSDFGRNQAWFEYASQLGELLNMEVVSLPVYSWGCAIGHALRMASRLTGRREIIIAEIFDPERLSVVENYCEPIDMASHITIRRVKVEAKSGTIDIADLKRKVTDKTAAVYFESPSYLGQFEINAAAIARIARQNGAETIVGVDPLTLGVARPPAEFGADIVVGPTQPMGVHMNCGGGVGGFMASRDEERYVREYNGFLVSITETLKPGQFGFGLASAHQTSYGMREQGKDWTGNSVYLWAIANAVYMSLLGPQGFREIGELILAQSHKAAKRLAKIKGVTIRHPSGFFKEFVVDFTKTGKTVAAINKKLRREEIFGGKDLSKQLPEFGQSALYCVTEIHTDEDIERLRSAIERAVRR
ncbi:MAG TPA: aminomethyl-transferring glycine dehydrogenase subunit GcvPA [Pseudolabrys sp.]|nr:aminomethyl-transferring glycine dehydrogenase subunit GcvPA [Pseudolabrys sp.]